MSLRRVLADRLTHGPVSRLLYRNRPLWKRVDFGTVQRGPRRDGVARALTGNLGGEPILLCDEPATAEGIRVTLKELQTSDPDDVVVVSFSEHGTSTHELVGFGVDINDLHASCIPLDELTGLISAIPAMQLICILDCCFSGGALAPRSSTRPRRPRTATTRASAAVKLDAMSGAGRLIVTASAADEPAVALQKED